MPQDIEMAELRQAERRAAMDDIAAEIMDEVTAWSEAHPGATWDELEKEVLKARQRFGERLMQRLVEEREEVHPVPGPRCPQCGQEMRYKGEKQRHIASSLGETQLKRGYYYCSKCKTGVFPLDKALDLRAGTPWSPHLLRLMTKLVARLPYAEAAEVLEEIGGVWVAPSSGWRIAQAWGARMQAELAGEEAEQKAAARAWSTPGGPQTTSERMGVAVDGAMMHIRKEGWKEFKVGCVYGVELETRIDAQTRDTGEFGHAVRPSYVAHLGGPEVFGWQMWAEAHRRGWRRAADTQMMGDGAPWIWNLHQEHFHESLETVDWYHATGHLGEAKLLLYPQEGAAASHWYNTYEKVLYQGHADQIARNLRATAAKSPDPQQAAELDKAAAYFANNRDRMHYQDLRDEGWPIGSGVVESAAKQFKARVTGPGMRWSRSGAEHILPLRAAVLTGRERFDELWSRAYDNSPPS
jgi:transposase